VKRLARLDRRRLCCKLGIGRWQAAGAGKGWRINTCLI
jgi:hypothetical protein